MTIIYVCAIKFVSNVGGFLSRLRCTYYAKHAWWLAIVSYKLYGDNRDNEGITFYLQQETVLVWTSFFSILQTRLLQYHISLQYRHGTHYMEGGTKLIVLVLWEIVPY